MRTCANIIVKNGKNFAFCMLKSRVHWLEKSTPPTTGSGWQKLAAFRVKKGTKVFVRCIFVIFATDSSLLRAIAKFANLIQYNTQHVPYNSALLAQEKHTFWPKEALFCPKSSKKCVNCDKCWGLKFSPKSKLFGEGPSRPRATSATLLPIVTNMSSDPTFPPF